MRRPALQNDNLGPRPIKPNAEKREFVSRESYELLMDASGFTVEQMAEITPEVLEKLGGVITRRKCEFMGFAAAHEGGPSLLTDVHHPHPTGQSTIRANF